MSQAKEVDLRNEYINGLMQNECPNRAQAEYVNKKAKKIKFSDFTLNLKCEWLECDFQSTDIEEFQSHIALHIDNGEANDKKPSDQSLERYFCNWKNCYFDTNNASEFYRHGFYHGFHTKLKCRGAYVVENSNAQPCRIGIENCNILPALTDPLICQWTEGDIVCCAEFNDCQTFYNHVVDHTVNLKKASKTSKISCFWQGCTSVVSCVALLKLHLVTHTQEKSVACPTCGGLFICNTGLRDHLLRQSQIDEEDKMYQCGHCLKKFISEKFLKSHVTKHINRYRCSYCEMSFPHPCFVVAHVHRRHSNDKPFSCKTCGHRAKTAFDVKRHSEIHENEYIHCPHEGCGYSTKRLANLKYHEKTNHYNGGMKRYLCHICEKRFRSGGILSGHLTSVHNCSLPAGHSRFRFQSDGKGSFTLQTLRYECIDSVVVIDEISSSSKHDIDCDFESD